MSVANIHLGDEVRYELPRRAERSLGDAETIQAEAFINEIQKRIDGVAQGSVIWLNAIDLYGNRTPKFNCRRSNKSERSEHSLPRLSIATHVLPLVHES